MKPIGLGGIATRFLFAFALVALTWNPSPVNFVRWAINQWPGDLKPLVLFVALALAAGWGVFIHATARSLGTLGVIFTIALAGTVMWMLNRWVLDLNNSTVLAGVVLTLVAAILTVGMSWSHLRRAWSGQADVDDVDEDN
jgi:hypothetical protein